jgi:hypothetical protein
MLRILTPLLWTVQFSRISQWSSDLDLRCVFCPGPAQDVGGALLCSSLSRPLGSYVRADPWLRDEATQVYIHSIMGSLSQSPSVPNL